MKFNRRTARTAGKRSGAARKEKSVIIEGLAAAAARVDLSVEALSAARKAGCTAFKPGGRVNLPELESWLLENGDIVSEGESLNALRRRNLLARVTAERIGHDELLAGHVVTADAAEAASLCSEASKAVALKMLPPSIRSIYIEKVSGAFAAIEKNMTRKTSHQAPEALIIKEPSESDSLDDLRAMLLSWKTKFLELENSIANDEMVPVENFNDMIADALRYPVSIARKHLDAISWNQLCVATKETFAHVLDPTSLPA